MKYYGFGYKKNYSIDVCSRLGGIDGLAQDINLSYVDECLRRLWKSQALHATIES